MEHHTNVLAYGECTLCTVYYNTSYHTNVYIVQIDEAGDLVEPAKQMRDVMFTYQLSYWMMLICLPFFLTNPNHLQTIELQVIFVEEAI